MICDLHIGMYRARVYRVTSMPTRMLSPLMGTTTTSIRGPNYAIMTRGYLPSYRVCSRVPTTTSRDAIVEVILLIAFRIYHN